MGMVEKDGATVRRLAPDIDVERYANFQDQVAKYLRERYQELSSRKDSSLTQEYIGQRLGLSKSAVNHLLSGRTALGFQHARKLADLLDVDLMAIPGIDAEREHLRTLNQGKAPTGYISEGVFERAWQLMRRHYPMADEQDKVEIALGVTKRLLKESPSEQELEDAIKLFMLERRK